ncbi:hypothetical protein J2D73_18455 [Acetobacter sacchari]|uniref:Uncharacterized protein n=1 Tax=Acetobacter sacchari TaxID=2661687 RepID=A0ABS3M0W6_9PROT|nr:hypothetical protein [Acetobacter sacchari]MBO1361767.1 hypothetical protein [Acetobacter sacchari]
MTDSIPAPERAKRIFGMPEACSYKALSILTREQLLKLAQSQMISITILHDDVINLLTIDNPPSREQMIKIAHDMLETIEDNETEHEVFYGGKPREKLMEMFPALRAKGEAA